MSSTIKLLPCPFCNNAEIAINNENPKDNSGGYFIECPGCGASTSLRFACGDDPCTLLAEQWNRRTTSHCPHQIQDPSPVQAAPRLDDAWKAHMLDGQALVRDKDGIGFHPALPDFDEGVKSSDFFAALGIELKGGMAENEMESNAYEAMTKNGLTNDGDNYNAWTPKRPEGDGWNLVAVFDTEDGPACWWMRDMPFVPQRTEGYRERVDNAAVEVLSMNMKAKLAGQRAKGYRGWNNDCTQQHLSDLLRDCVKKGDPVDVANFCAFLLSRGETIAPPAAPPTSQRDELLQVALDFIGTLTGMSPPPIEVAPPEVFSPFYAFVDRVQAITAPQAQADTQDAESDYQRGYRHGYNRRDAEVSGALL